MVKKSLSIPDSTDPSPDSRSSAPPPLALPHGMEIPLEPTERLPGETSDQQMVVAPWQRQALAMHLSGWPLAEIAIAAEQSAGAIYDFLSTKEARHIIGSVYSMQDKELGSLNGQATGAIRRGLSSQDQKMQLKAAELALRATGKMGGMGEQENTAEDVIQRIIEMMSSGPDGQETKVRIVERRTRRFGPSPSSAQKQEPV